MAALGWGVAGGAGVFLVALLFDPWHDQRWAAFAAVGAGAVLTVASYWDWGLLLTLVVSMLVVLAMGIGYHHHQDRKDADR